MEPPVLKEPTVFPSQNVLEAALGKAYTVYEELINALTRKKN